MTQKNNQAAEPLKKKRGFYIKIIMLSAVLVVLGFFVVIRSYLNAELFKAVQDNDITKIRQLVNFGADVNTSNRIGWTPLIYGVRSNRKLDVLRTLIDIGADVNAADDMGWTSLMFLAYDSSEADTTQGLPYATASALKPYIIKLLLDSGADVGIKNKEGKNALYYAETNKALQGTDAYNLLREKTLSQKE